MGQGLHQRLGWAIRSRPWRWATTRGWLDCTSYTGARAATATCCRIFGHSTAPTRAGRLSGRIPSPPRRAPGTVPRPWGRTPCWVRPASRLIGALPLVACCASACCLASRCWYISRVGENSARPAAVFGGGLLNDVWIFSFTTGVWMEADNGTSTAYVSSGGMRTGGSLFWGGKPFWPRLVTTLLASLLLRAV